MPTPIDPGNYGIRLRAVTVDSLSGGRTVEVSLERDDGASHDVAIHVRPDAWQSIDIRAMRDHEKARRALVLAVSWMVQKWLTSRAIPDDPALDSAALEDARKQAARDDIEGRVSPKGVGCQNSITPLTSGFLLAREGPDR